MNLSSPIVLDPRNFTSLTQTPWAGNLLAQGIKSQVVSDRSISIGESWEFSCDPKFPSKTFGSNQTLTQIFQDAGLPPCEILVKLLNAKTPLSLQVHPADDDPHLKPNESGKTESWLVLDAKEGAGIYLGFSKEFTAKDIQEKLLQKKFVESDLFFLPVKRFDYFEIDPGVVHIVGPDLVILEPQRVPHKKSAKTYRLWDWNRLYDAQGKPHLQGQSRELHLDQAIPLIDFKKQHGANFANSLRRTPNVYQTISGLNIRCYPENASYQTIYASSDKGTQNHLTMENKNGYGSLLALKGSLTLEGSTGNAVRVDQGFPVFLPPLSFPLKVITEINTEFSLVVPKNSGIEFE